MNPLKTLTRLFGRSQSPIVSQLYAHAIGQPLLIHPQMGEALITGYMTGAVDARPPTMEMIETLRAEGDPAAGSAVAVINISGALVNRPTAGPCGGPGPMSYTEIRAAFDAAMADPAAGSIVFRMESPGGMVSGCFELAEHIRASRGAKPIYASLDDYAYSAAFALAVAADEIWTTRTAGAGSVGVVGYHVDESGALAAQGVKVTPIYSGKHKLDMSPHQPLAESVRDRLQVRMDRLRGEFAQLVADSRGLSVDAVLATEAMTYEGTDAVEAGFADRVGTFRELLAHIAAGGKPEREQSEEGASDPLQIVRQMEAEAYAEVSRLADQARAANEDLRAILESATTPEDLAEAVEAMDAVAAEPAETLGALLTAVTASTLPPAIGLALMKAQPKMEPAAAVEYAHTVRDLCAAAGVESLAADLVANGTPVETARSQLLDLKATSGPEITTSLPTKSAGPVQSRYDSVYSRLRAAAAGNGQ